VRVLLRSPFSPFSGYGNDGIGLASALTRWGCDVRLQPTHIDAPLPQSIADLLTKPLEAPFDLTINHVDPGQLELSPEARKSSELTVGWTMWEYSTMDNLSSSSKRTLKKRITKSFDLMLSYDDVSYGALDPYVTKEVTHSILQGGYEPDEWKPLERDWYSNRFGFCMVGMLSERKDPFLAVQAFQKLKESYPKEFEGAELHLKTQVPGLHPAMEQWIPKLRVHYDVWPKSILEAFYGKQHVLLAPSRGEGKNMPALEFQSTGGAVIATNWGGHTQWLRPEWGYPLNYELHAESSKFPNCKQARASVDHLADLMMHTYKNRDEVRRKGELASQTIPNMCSWDSVVRRLFERCRAVPGKGERLYQKAMSIGMMGEEE